MEIGLMLKQLTEYSQLFWDAFLDIDMYENPNVTVSESKNMPGQKALLSQQSLEQGEVVFVFTGKVSFLRTRTSIQVDFDKHVEAGAFGSFTNHSCMPNCVLRSKLLSNNMVRVVLITFCSVEKGCELTFDYASTEVDLTNELKHTACLCKSVMCRGKIYSFGSLSVFEKQQLAQQKILTDYLQNSMVLIAGILFTLLNLG